MSLVESGAVAPVRILANEYYTNIRGVTTTVDESDLGRLHCTKRCDGSDAFRREHP